jgi:transcriptional regulator of acetoin/glycerol metabolism
MYITVPPAPTLRRARLHLLEHGVCPTGVVDERVARSWQRSLAAGLLPDGPPTQGDHADSGLGELLERNHELLAHSRPLMDYLFAQLRESMVILADGHGTLLHTLGDAGFLGKAERVALTAGASWHERDRGTNAIGTALAEADAVEIHGAEHFLERHGFLTCAAAPIMSAGGELLGILDISGDRRGRHPHSLALVGMAVRLIENRMVVASGRHPLRLHLHARREGTGTVAEGIVILSADGWIVGANRQGLALLRLTRADLGATPLSRVIEPGLDELLARHRRDPDQPSQVRLGDGSTLFAQLHAAAPAVASARQAATPLTTPSDALTSLDTGDSRWRSATDKARRVAGKPIPLLIQGESGVGKELFARACHDSGPRRDGPFVAINCAALPENLIEAELFGYSPGAYTGSRREGSRGRLREAHGGTLFLDEIGDMPLPMQTRLLRVLQERQVNPLGGGRAVDVDFTLICATHQNLRGEAEQGRFRSDLYYRINGLTLHLPALRERGDFQALTMRLLADLNPGRPVRIAAELLAKLARHPWPGNLRQYASVLRTASAMLDADQDRLDWRHLPEDLAEELGGRQRQTPRGADLGARRKLNEISLAAIRLALEDSHGNISAAARCLGISRQTLYRKLNRERDAAA